MTRSFQSAPLTEARGDPRHWRKTSDAICFNPLPSPKQGETCSGDTCHRSGPCFNPLPSPKQGETSRCAPPRPCTARFNPLPSPKQGETPVHRNQPRVRPHVSIRSPHRSKGRLGVRRAGSSIAAVSIRSPHRSKGRPFLPSQRPRRTNSFNPLPSPKQGETQAEAPFRTKIVEFQSAPLTEARGDAIPAKRLAMGSKFQSAPLTEARGDPWLSVNRSYPAWFQSAPLTEARGDPSDFLLCFNPLPSPKQGETWRAPTWKHCSSFNPLPSPKQGETPPLLSGAETKRPAVSIRSPHRSKGRRKPLWPV